MLSEALVDADSERGDADSEADVLADSEADVNYDSGKRGDADSEADVLADTTHLRLLILMRSCLLTQRHLMTLTQGAVTLILTHLLMLILMRGDADSEALDDADSEALVLLIRALVDADSGQR